MPEARDRLVTELRRLLGPSGLLTGPAALSVYARDASHLQWGTPLAVALPASEEDLARVVALCAAAGVTVVMRGAGTGLSGGAVPPPGALAVSTARLAGLGPVDAVVGAVRAQPGVLNAAVSRHAAPHGLHFAPDPSSQAASTLGGNIAENAGGPHCLSHGVTSHHLRSLDWCDAEGRPWSTGEPVAVARGLDLRGLLCGSEGTLGIVTGAWLQLTPEPAAVRTLLAEFPALEAATAAVPRLLQAGVLPVAVEIIDQAMIATVEQAFAFGLPLDVEAVMIAELAGPAATADAGARATTDVLLGAGARAVRAAADAAERLALWQCRKRAFGAVGRLSPNYVSMDVVVPLGQLSGLVREIQEVRARFDVKIATAFHAGDGNLHPAVHYDERRAGDRERAHAAADAIIKAALRRGGSVTGEHGVGLEKVHALPWQVDAVSASLLRGIKDVFDPAGRLNPGKALPAAGPAVRYAAIPSRPTSLRVDVDSLAVTAPAGTPVADLQEAALAHGLWLPLGLAGRLPAPGLDGGGTIGEAVARLLEGPMLLARATARDLLLEAWAEAGDGRAFHAGAAVAKNVAGYDLLRLLCGSGGTLATLRAVTLQLRPAPAGCWGWSWTAPGDGDAGGAPAVAPAGHSGPGGSVWLAALAAGCDPLAGLQVVIERSPAGVPTRVLALGGGTQPLLPAGSGGAVVEARRANVGEAAALLSELEAPGWCLGSADWTAWQPVAGAGTALLPPGPDRFLWQHGPRVVWLPGCAPVAAEGWRADIAWRNGHGAPLPPPPPGSPLHVLRGLKRTFDPEGKLGGPGWLTGGGDA